MLVELSGERHCYSTELDYVLKAALLSLGNFKAARETFPGGRTVNGINPIVCFGPCPSRKFAFGLSAAVEPDGDAGSCGY